MPHAIRRALMLALAALVCLSPLLSVRPTFAASCSAGVTICVTNANDSGAGSLRAAIDAANASSGGDVIGFGLNAGETWTLNLASPLPALTGGNLTIDALSASNTPQVALNGANISWGPGTVGDGFTISSAGNTIRGLALYGFRGLKYVGGYGAGIVITSAAASGNVVEYSYIGTNLAGTGKGNSSPNNQSGGIVIIRGASNNIIRNNVIAGNNSYGIFVSADTSTSNNDVRGNLIRDNKIGVDVSGNTALANASAGVYIGDTSFDTIIGPGNIISGNGTDTTTDVDVNNGFGVVVDKNNGTGSGEIIRGNRIGIGANGSSIPNKVGGVKLTHSVGVTIGGTNAPDSSNDDRGNIIAGNNLSNVVVTNQAAGAMVATSTTIKNNYIGLKSATAASDTSNTGIRIQRAVSGITIDGNTISAHALSAIELDGTLESVVPTGVTIANNKIGTNAAGTADVTGSTSQGIYAHDGVTGITIDSNLISGNGGDGIRLNNISGAAIRNNTIGGLLGGNSSVGNGAAGIDLLGTSKNNIIGPGNTIVAHTSASTGDGVVISSGTSANTVKGNTITGNTRGIRIDGSASNLIGALGTAGKANATDGNIIRNNTVGVLVNGAAATANRVNRTTTSNNVSSGTHAGISLTSGGNAGVATPSVASAALAGGTLTVTGLNTNGANCGSGCLIEVFHAVTAEPNEGKFFLSSFTASGGGNYTISGVTSCMPNLTFTTTDQAGNTSQFSTPITATGCTQTSEPSNGAMPDLFNETPPSTTVSTNIANSDIDVSFTAQLQNVGGADGAFNMSVTTDAATYITNLTVSPNPSPSLTAGGSATTITFGARVKQGTPAGTYHLTLTATQQGGSGADSVEVAIVVPLAPALALSAASTTPQPGGPNDEVCFTHVLTNNGNGTDSFTITITPPTGWASRVQSGSPVTVPKGATSNVVVCVTVPNGQAGGTYPFTVTAQSVTNPKPSAQRTDTVQVQDAAVPQISAAAAQSADPGDDVTFSHTLSNVGNIDDTFTLSVALPTGWTMVTPPTSPIGPVTKGGGSVNFSYTVHVPSGALAKAYQLVITAEAVNYGTGPKTQTDTVNVNQVASLSLTPASQTAPDESPNTVVTYTLTLKNNGNFRDTITLTADASQAASGWTVALIPESVALDPGASQTIQVELHIPPGQAASVSNLTTVRATSSIPSEHQEATITTGIKAVPGVLIEPHAQVKSASAGSLITFDFTVMNSGSVDQTISAALGTVTNPVGATVIFTGTTTPQLLTPGQTIAVKLTVQVPDDAPDNTDIVAQILASSDNTNSTGQGASDEATATVRIGPPYAVIIDPDRAGAALPGEIIQYTHYVTNTGRMEDSITLQAQSNLGWITSVSPASVRLAAFASTAVTVTVQVPGTANAGAIDTTYITARSVGDPTAFDRATATTTVLQQAGVNISPNRTARTQPGKLYFLHTLSNIGNGVDTYTITTTQDLDWAVTVNYTEPRGGLPRGSSQLVQIVVTVPDDVGDQVRNRIVVRATSKYDPTVYSEATDIIVPDAIVSGLTYSTYLPMVQK
ncbi:hypothetical protein F8S13_04665 [Chloroflexia bacterium SDU3-3]|nr:hypothetical protein F8S13_04665 [Chloroflexia bacterium SDU3-3]